MKIIKSISYFCLSASLLFFASCEKKQPAQNKNKLTVITTLFPIYDFTKNIGGELVETTLLLPPGVEAHDFEPRPSDILKINQADVFIYTGKYMEPWAQGLIKSLTNTNLLVVDSSKGIEYLGSADQEDEDEHENHHHGAMDPHIWLDFSNAQKMVKTIAEALSQKDPKNKDSYLKNADDYNQKLTQLDEEYKAAIINCKNRNIVFGGHFAFGYLAKRYNLEFISAYRGFTSDSEPTPKGLAELSQKIKELSVKYIFYEEMLSPKIAHVLSEESGTELLPLNSAHNVSKDTLTEGIGFTDIMKKNLENLKKGLECQ